MVDTVVIVACFLASALFIITLLASIIIFKLSRRGKNVRRFGGGRGSSWSSHDGSSSHSDDSGGGWGGWGGDSGGSSGGDGGGGGGGD